MRATLLLILVAGCSGEMMPAPVDRTLPPGAVENRMLASDFEIPAGTEFYQCQRITLTDDLYVVRIAPESPKGVHHQVLAIDPSPSADGTSKKTGDCPPTGKDWKPIYASGVGTGPLIMPSQVAFKAQKGEQLVLGLHLFNATQQTITGQVGVKVSSVSEVTGYQFAGFPYVGPLGFTVGASQKVAGSCRIQTPTTLFAVFPHMHQTGDHLKIVAGGKVVWDRDYSFNEQRFGTAPDWDAPAAEVKLTADDFIDVECHYAADGIGKKFGDSSTDEMCFGFAFVYPAIPLIANSPYCSPF